MRFSSAASRIAALGTIAALLSAAPQNAGANDTRPLPAGARVTFEHGDARVGTYVSSPWGFSTNSFWIEGHTGLILIDTQFLPSAIEEAVTWIESSTQKKIALAIVLHPNPDKFNGTGFLKSRGIKVVTSDQVRKLIPAVHEKRVKAFYERYQPDYPKDLTLPDSFGTETTELTAGGITIKAHVLGKGCGDAHVVVEFGKHLFTGDLVANGSHSWFELGHAHEWLDRVEEMSALDPKFVHPGRGPSGGPELLVRQKFYIQRAIAMISKQIGEGKKPDPKTLKKDFEEIYPGYRFAPFLAMGLPAVWESLEAARAKTTITPISAPSLLAKLKSSKARAMIVNVWATWCAPCLEEMPALLRIHRKYRDRGLELHLFSADAPDAKSGAEELLRQLGADFPSWQKTGTDDELINTFEKSWSGALPATLIYSRGVKKTHFTEGVITADKLEAEVRAALGLRP